MNHKCVIVAGAAVGAFLAPALAQTHYQALPIPANQVPPSVPGASASLAWNTFEAGAGVLSGGSLSLVATTGQADTGLMSMGSLTIQGGFWPGVGEIPFCYADCDQSGGSPRLTANDFACFMNRFSTGDPYANCDASTTPPALNVLDFQCFLLKFAAGCP